MKKSTRVGMIIPPHLTLADQIRTTRFLEQLGFDSAWWPDHLLYADHATGHDCWTIMAAAATQTRRILLGAAVSDPHRVHPAVFAQRAATLDQLSRGRVLLGLGSGEAMNLDPFGIPWEDRKVGRLREFLQVLRGLLDTPGPLDHSGPLFRLQAARLGVRPYQNRRIPVYLAALGPQMQKLAREMADGWFPVPVPSELYREYAAPVQKDGMDMVAQVILALLPDGKQATAEQLATVVRPFAGSIVWDVAARRMGLPLEPPPHLAGVDYHKVNPCDPESLRKFEEYSQWLPAETLLRFVLVGDRRHVLRGLQAYQEAGVTHFALINGSPDPVEALGILSRDIMPVLTGRPPTLAGRALAAATPLLKRAGITRRFIPEGLDVWGKVRL